MVRLLVVMLHENPSNQKMTTKRPAKSRGVGGVVIDSVLLLLLLLVTCANTTPQLGSAITAPARVVSKTTTAAFASSSSSSSSNNNDVVKNQKIPPPPPISMPVWSMAVPVVSTESSNSNDSIDDDDVTTTSMNIVTFATPVSVAPKKLWIVSLYHGTRTKDAFFAAAQSPIAVLQLLEPQHKHLVPILGKRSGYEAGYSKAAACAAVPHAVVDDSSTVDTCTDTKPVKQRKSLAWVTNHAPPTDDNDSNNNDNSSSTAVFAPGIALLPDCAAYIQLELLSSSSSSSSSRSNSKNTLDAGDHIVALCQVTATGRWDEARQKVVPNISDDDDDNEPLKRRLDPSAVLYTGLLRDEGII
jgi:hypothetical protein